MASAPRDLRCALEEAARRGLALPHAPMREEGDIPTDPEPEAVYETPPMIRDDLPRTMSLYEFVRGAWHIVEPATPFVDNWHIRVICDHLEAATYGRTVTLQLDPDDPNSLVSIECGLIRNLIINVPPRCMKSVLVCVMWFCWVWTFRPWSRWIFASYAENLSTRDSRKCRQVIQSSWYRRRFGTVFRLVDDQNQKTRFENEYRGYRIATTVAGIAVGEGADFLIADDPNKTGEAESKAHLEMVHEWWDETMSTRGNNPQTFVRALVQQRLNELDLTGHWLKSGVPIDHVVLPMEYEATDEARARVTSIGFRDPRTVEGELLWKNRFYGEALDALKAGLKVYGVAGQFQQRPAPRGGGMFKIVWFQIKDAAPAKFDRIIRYWDKAATEGGGAATAGVLIAAYKRPFATFPDIWILDCVAGHWSPYNRNQIMILTARLDRLKYGWGVETFIEKEGGSGGKESAEISAGQLQGYNITLDAPTGDKRLRAEPFADQLEAGNVYVLEGEWLVTTGYLQQFEKFPRGLKDMVDATSGGFNNLVLPKDDMPIYAPETATGKPRQIQVGR